MINSTTPYKLAELIRDTWPGLYNSSKPSYNNQKDTDDERVLDRNRE